LERSGRITDASTEQEIISEEIVDETDRYEDNFHKVKARRMTTAAVMRGLVPYSVLLQYLLLIKLGTIFNRIVERVGRRDSAPTHGDRTPLITPRSPDGNFSDYGAISESPKAT
jgi:hypothetical protein